MRLRIPPRPRRRLLDNAKDKFTGTGARKRLRELWLAEEIWPDSTVYVIGGGPSVSKMPLRLLKGKHVVGVNSAVRLGDWVAVNFFGDARWLEWEYQWAKVYKGTLVTCQAKLRNPDDIEIKRLAKSQRRQGISTKRYEISWNNSSGGAAINLAYHLGARRIVLIGYDMGVAEVDGEIRHNFHDAYPISRPERNPYRHFMKAFENIKLDADKLGVEILDATPHNALSMFEHVKLEEVAGV